MIFEFDQYIQDKPYPNLALHQAVPYTPEWRQFSQHWPFSEPPKLIEYCNDESVSLDISASKNYLIAVSFFDFSIEWFKLIPADRLEQMQQGKLNLVFFYNEGDNPERIQQHLLQQCKEYHVPESMLFLILGNSSADLLNKACWFPDHELLYRKRNRDVAPLLYHEQPRKQLFTALVRTHKWWRATTMTEFWRRGWHTQGFFSYNSDITVGEQEHDNPIEVDLFEGLRSDTHKFLENCPFKSDNLNSNQHNDHHLCVPEHYNDSYLNVVLETHMDADQSGGVFLTEKTFKPIKHAQPFVVFGAVNTLARLRDLGYRTFDGIIDNSYDSISDTTQRWAKLISILEDMFSGGHQNMHKIYCACHQDLVHNQQHFLSSKQDRLNKLLKKVICE